jgi:nicotinamide-nucleotide amidase
MMTLCCDVLNRLQGKTLVTAESLTGGGIGAALTAVSGSSSVYKGGIISYTNEVKHHILGVKTETLDKFGAVSAQTAAEMAAGVREVLHADVAVSVTGLAGPGGDDYGKPVGTVFLGYCDADRLVTKECHFSGNREAVRNQTIQAALNLVLEHNESKTSPKVL